MNAEYYSEGSFRNLVVKYDPEQILLKCYQVSKKFLDEHTNLITIKWYSQMGNYRRVQNIHIGSHQIAALALRAIKNHHLAFRAPISDDDFVKLANAVTYIKEPERGELSSREEKLIKLLVPMAYEQFPYQEDIYYALARHLILYLETSVKNPPINVDEEFLRIHGFRIRDFITLCYIFLASSLAHAKFNRSFLEDTKEERLKPFVSAERIDKFLNIAAADFDEFRRLCIEEDKKFTGAGKYQFNPLFDRPIIILPDGSFCAPLPTLLVNRATKGLYYDLLSHFSTDTGNLFSTWFGHAFEQHCGLHLKYIFGTENVYEEPKYGKPVKGGPDWTVISGDTAIIFECRSGRLTRRAKTYGDYQDIAALVERNLVDTLTKIPGKIDDLKSGQTDIPLDGVKTFIPCIVTYEPYYPEELFKELLIESLAGEGIPEFDFEFMSVEDFDWLLNWSSLHDPVSLILDKWSKPETKNAEIRRLIGEEIRQQGTKGQRIQFLEIKAREFWQAIGPDFSTKPQ